MNLKKTPDDINNKTIEEAQKELKQLLLDLEESKNLAQCFSSKNPVAYNYRLIFTNKDEINKLKKEVEENKAIESIEVRYAP